LAPTVKDNCGCNSAKKASGQILHIKRDFYLLLVMGRFQDCLVLCIFTFISEDWLIHETPFVPQNQKGKTRKESHIFTFLLENWLTKTLFVHP
jgi:hypothetical protein